MTNNIENSNTQSKIAILLEVTASQALEIETICARQGITYSKYFIDLHEKTQGEKEKPKKNK